MPKRLRKTTQEMVEHLQYLAKSQEKTREGEKFGKWTVGARVGKKGNNTYYTCTCECGTVLDISISSLTHGRTTQCRSCSSTRNVCAHGHDTAEYGRNGSGQCRVCAKAYAIFHKYEYTLEEYKALFDFQQGKCAICGKPLRFMSATVKTKDCFGRPEIDHKHYLKKDAKKINKKDTVRGILCGGRYAGCNSKLGHVDNVTWLTAAALYLTNPPAQQLFKKEGNVNL